MAESIHLHVKEDDLGDENSEVIISRLRADHFNQKVTRIERIILVINFILELPSAVFDQLSSVHKPQYALLSMLMSFTVLIISIIDLVHQGRKEKVSWMKKGMIPWFRYPNRNRKPFGTFLDMIGLICVIIQCVFTSIAYAFLSRHADNPIKMNIWPMIFAFGLLCSRFQKKNSQKMPASAFRSSRNGKEFTSPVKRMPTNSLVRTVRYGKEFTLPELSAATDDFKNKIHFGSFGTVYKGKLPDAQEVAIKRRLTGKLGNLTILSTLSHKNLVRLVGYCEDRDDKLLVYEYMNNRSLYEHLHDKKNIDKKSSMINSWQMRIKIALDAATGINYLHNELNTKVIHRNIKSSNILLDTNWGARVSDFGLSLLGSESDICCLDPENIRLLNSKNDMYGFGVILLELLTGKAAIFEDIDSGWKPTDIVSFAVPKILANELFRILDRRVGLPELTGNEAEALDLVAKTAVCCLNLEGKNWPTMSDVVANLKQSFCLCDGWFLRIINLRKGK